MINITFTRNDKERSLLLDIKGHAGFSELGEDIVCSAVSILAYTLAEHLAVCCEQGIISVPDLHLKDGNAKIECKTDKEKVYKYLLGEYAFVQLGFELIQNTYPENVKLIRM